ncbi:MAG: chitobiase/beta-hexosaminidase C-terminal domain-containing protein [Fibrobacteria bacterium]|nr:chitobiase/beta-hexosaminidase C-terminal domain-containing protein [Fibrobacteria bacterium]
MERTMKMSVLLLSLLLGVVFVSESWSVAKYRYDKNHEDSVRVLVLWNYNSVGSTSCPSGTRDVGRVAKDFVLEAINGVPNIEIRRTEITNLSAVKAVFAPNLPHVLVHVQAGWRSQNGPYLPEVITYLTQNGVGIVSVGDDAAFTASQIFGITDYSNGPAPMGAARDYPQLWITLNPENDVPQEPGIIKNAVKYYVPSAHLDFKPYAVNGRCEADADKFTVLPSFLHVVSFMGFQQGVAPNGAHVGNVDEFSTILAFGNDTRRAVNLSFQPQYLQNAEAVEQITYDAIMWASLANQGFEVEEPVADPASKSFEFAETVSLNTATTNAKIYYSLNNGTYQLYTTPIEITETTVLKAFARDGKVSSDTITENYIKTAYDSKIELTSVSGQILSGISGLTETDNQFIVTLTAPYATLTSVVLDISTGTSKDIETFILKHSRNTGNALIFTDTLNFAVLPTSPSNGMVEVSSFDRISASWDNPLNSQDKPEAAFQITPLPLPGKVYFADEYGEKVVSLTGEETLLYVVVEDQEFDPSRLDEYSITLTNTKAENNTSLPDKETFKLRKIAPGKYGATVPVTLSKLSPAVVQGNSRFEIRKGDMLSVVYVDPVDKLKAQDDQMYGIQIQQSGIIHFANANFTVPARVIESGKWDASQGRVYLYYEDDYVSTIIRKTADIVVIGSDENGAEIVDRETVHLHLSGQRGEIGEWTIELPLIEDTSAIPGDGILQYYFSSEIRVEVATHMAGTVEKLAGDISKAVLPLMPAPYPGTVFFASKDWEPISSFTGDEERLYIVVMDRVYDKDRMDEYVVTVTNTKGENNTALTDKESYKLMEIAPGKFGVIVPVSPSSQSPPVIQGNGKFRMRKGDGVKVVYVDPVDQLEASDSKNFGMPGQQKGQIYFSNADYSIPALTMERGIWDASSGMVYLYYEDDYISGLIRKSVHITLTSTDGQGRKIIDTEMAHLNLTGKNDSIGIWTLELMLHDNPTAVPGDGKLQFYFSGEIVVNVATHRAGTIEKLAGDTVKAVLSTAYANRQEQISLRDATTGSLIYRQTNAVKVCVEDQVFSAAYQDTLLLEKVECKSSGDLLKGVELLQTTFGSNEYCGVFKKDEAMVGAFNDDVLHCQDIDNLVAYYTDPVYGTSVKKVVSIMDNVNTEIQLIDLAGNSIIKTYRESKGNRIKVRLTHNTPDIYLVDTLYVTLSTDAGDALTVRAIETSKDNGVFEAVVSLGFTELPDKHNNVIEGRLNPGELINTMMLTAQNGPAAISITVTAAYVPVEKAWIVDGNGDGQVDSIFVNFKSSIPSLPGQVSSIDWPYEGAQEQVVQATPSFPEFSPVNYVPGNLSTITVVLPGVLDRSQAVFPADVTGRDIQNPPFLNLPEGPIFQGQRVTIEDAVGPVIVSAEKRTSGNVYYKDVDGIVRKRPDTLIITISEKIRQLHNAGTPWDSLFFFKSRHMENKDAYPLISLAGVNPVVQGFDSLSWIFILDNGTETIKPLIDDELFMSPLAPYVDASPAQNRPQDVGTIITGVEPSASLQYSNIYVPVVGADVDDPLSLMANLHINENGAVTPGRDLVLMDNGFGEYAYARMWVKPVGLQWDGSVMDPGTECSMGFSEQTGLSEYPENCLSTVQVFIDDAYTAEIAIFDHMGKYIFQSVQYFGHCGEIDNKYRRTTKGIQSWLVWNQKDMHDRYVGTGVYIWKVKFTTSKGSHMAVYRQGIVRSGIDPMEGCAVQ